MVERRELCVVHEDAVNPEAIVAVGHVEVERTRRGVVWWCPMLLDPGVQRLKA